MIYESYSSFYKMSKANKKFGNIYIFSIVTWYSYYKKNIYKNKEKSNIKREKHTLLVTVLL